MQIFLYPVSEKLIQNKFKFQIQSASHKLHANAFKSSKVCTETTSNQFSWSSSNRNMKKYLSEYNSEMCNPHDNRIHHNYSRSCATFLRGEVLFI